MYLQELLLFFLVREKNGKRTYNKKLNENIANLKKSFEIFCRIKLLQYLFLTARESPFIAFPYPKYTHIYI